MPKRSWLLFLLALAACWRTGVRAPGPATDAVVFRNVRIFDGQKMLPRTQLLVRAGTIVAVADQVDSPAGATVIDGEGDTLLPGLIDSHAHVSRSKQLEQALVFGITTVLDMAADPKAIAALRAQEETSDGLGMADLRSAVNVATAPNGHGTEYGYPVRTLNRAQDAPAFVDTCIHEGSDYIKIIYNPRNPRFPSLDRETMTALVDAAHARKKLAVVHVETLDDALEAISAGADGLAHLFLDKRSNADFADLVLAKKAFVVPTLSVLRSVSGPPAGTALAVDPELAPYLTQGDVENMNQSFMVKKRPEIAVALDTVRKLTASGVPILAGTDAPNPGTALGPSLHGELELLVEAGLAPFDALVAATSAPARAFALDDRGKIAPGARADLVLVKGDPTEDIKATRRIVGVWKRGTPIDRGAFRAAIGAERAKAAAEARDAAAPPGSGQGLVSDFEGDRVDAKFGAGWVVSTDRMAGGRSTAGIELTSPGANGSRGALAISGSVEPRERAGSWAGAMFWPGSKPMTPANLSSKRQIVFRAKGDGKTYDVLIFTHSHGDHPGMMTFDAAADWREYGFKLADFGGIDGHDVTGVFFGAGAPGAFSLLIDDVAFR